MIQVDKDLKELRKILRELQRTCDSDGCYNPYNLVHSYIEKIAHESLEDLRLRVNVCKPQRI